MAELAHVRNGQTTEGDVIVLSLRPLHSGETKLPRMLLQSEGAH